jgi:hypothetical protein
MAFTKPFFAAKLLANPLPDFLHHTGLTRLISSNKVHGFGTSTKIVSGQVFGSR